MRAAPTYRKQELLDFLHGVRHAEVGLGHGCEHLDEDVQLHGQVGVLGFAAFPQPLLLKTRARQQERPSAKANTRLIWQTLFISC